MTSKQGADAHPEVAEISDLSEGLLPPERGAEVREHIAGCGLCADVLSSLEEIRGLLGTLPGPQRMPGDVAGRIDAALAAEALLSAERVDVPRETPAEPSPTHTPPAHVPRGTPVGGDAPAGHPTAPTGPGRRGGSGSHPAGRRPRRRGLLAAASAAAVLALGGVIYGAATTGSGNTNADRGLVTTKQAGGSAVSDQIGGQVRQLLGRSPKDGQADTPMFNEHTDVAPNTRTASAVPDCVLKATHRVQNPLAIERESFQGTDSYLVVLPHPGDASSVDAFVVNASCASSSPGAVLFQATYPR